MREEFTDLSSVGSELPEFDLRPKTDQLLPLKLGELLTLGKAFGHGLAVHCSQLRFGIENFQVRRSTGHRQPDHPFGLLWKWQWVDHTAR